MVDLLPGKCCCIHAEAVPISPAIRKKLQIYGHFLRGWGQVTGVGTSTTQRSSTTAARSSAPQNSSVLGSATTKEVNGQMLIIIQLLQSATHSTNLSCPPFHRWHIQGCWQPFQTYLYPMQGPDGGSIPCAFGPYTAGSTGCSGRLSGSGTGQTLPPKLW